MTTADTGYRMLSDDFLRDHRALMAKYPVNKAWAADNSGAHDHVLDPRIRRAKRQMASDRRMMAGIARDQEGIHGGAPDREAVRLVLKAVRQACGEVEAHRVSKLLSDKWPELFMSNRDDDDDTDEIEMEAQDEADMDDPPANPNPNQNYGGRGREAFSQDRDYPSNAGRNIGGPESSGSWPGMPRRGGTMTPMTGDAALRAHARRPGSHIKVDPYPAMMNGMPARSTKQRGRTSSGMAMDSKAVDDYAKMFPDAMKIGLLG